MYFGSPVALPAIPSVPIVYVFFVFDACIVIYSKTCVKGPLEN